MATDENIGKEYKTKNHGIVRVVSFDSVREVITIRKRRYKYYKVEFLDTGNTDVFNISHIKRGVVKDRVKEAFTPRASGVGFIGELMLTMPEKTKLYKSLYPRWNGMIRRVYNKKSSRYDSYGGSGVTIDKRWHNFSNYYEDVQKLDGFDVELIIGGKLDLDKDKKQVGVENKVYSKDTCVWLSKRENANYQLHRQKWFKALSPEGLKFEDHNMRRFASTHGLSRVAISRALESGNKNVISLKGWKFYKLDDKEVL